MTRWGYGLECAATIAGENVMWFPETPDERDPRYFRTWRRVSVELQKAFRKWASEIYFRDAANFSHRDDACTMVVFSASRPFYTRSRTEFTYDMAEPEQALASAWRTIGMGIKAALAALEKHLFEAGRVELAHRFAPVWHQDFLVAVQNRRRREFIRMLAREARLIDAVIDLGTRRNAAAERRFEWIATKSLRNFLGVDMTELIPRILELAAEVVDRRNHLRDRRVRKRRHARAAGSPHGGIGAQENGDDWRPDCRGEVRDAGIVADVNARRGEPTCQLV